MQHMHINTGRSTGNGGEVGGGYDWQQKQKKFRSLVQGLREMIKWKFNNPLFQRQSGMKVAPAGQPVHDKHPGTIQNINKQTTTKHLQIKENPDFCPNLENSHCCGLVAVSTLLWFYGFLFSYCCGLVFAAFWCYGCFHISVVVFTLIWSYSCFHINVVIQLFSHGVVLWLFSC